MQSEGCILVIDGDKILSSVLSEALAKAGYRVVLADNGIDGLQEVYTRQPDLILLDVMTPRLNGWETLSRLRQIAKVPVIFITSKRSESDKLLAFQMGADDCVSKPFSVAELTARVRAVLRRYRDQPADEKRARFTSGELVMDVDSHRVTKAGREVELTPTEFRLLQTLAEHAGRVLTHEQLLERVWGYDSGEDTGYIKRYIWYLRQKLEDDPAKPQHIITKRDFGYSFCAD